MCSADHLRTKRLVTDDVWFHAAIGFPLRSRRPTYGVRSTHSAMVLTSRSSGVKPSSALVHEVLNELTSMQNWSRGRVRCELASKLLPWGVRKGVPLSTAWTGTRQQNQNCQKELVGVAGSAVERRQLSDTAFGHTDPTLRLELRIKGRSLVLRRRPSRVDQLCTFSSSSTPSTGFKRDVARSVPASEGSGVPGACSAARRKVRSRWCAPGCSRVGSLRTANRCPAAQPPLPPLHSATATGCAQRRPLPLLAPTTRLLKGLKVLVSPASERERGRIWLAGGWVIEAPNLPHGPVR
ncbi:hypothetical protein GGX14DRAFT_404876 [Mycena pura]|uniref:Uncharacterized protein n=1 Tax=Mycena pura TaxID=153505 RepID=A0AAD6Y350_9AGAR|nr:hypothetical protein GGX14DRAFT_404876 [Mycena pura]